VREARHIAAEVHGARLSGLGVRPRDRGLERPVDLHGRRVPLERAQVGQQAGGQLGRGEHVLIQRGRGHGGEHGAARPRRFAVGIDDADRAAARDPHLAYPPPANDLAAALGQPRGQCGGQRASAALGYREADVLGEHA
jgi:hypothetical protein